MHSGSPCKERLKAFDDFRKEGIYQENKKRIKSGHGDKLYRERRQGEAPLMLCNVCSGFYAKQHFHRHKERCLGKTEAADVTINAIPAELLLDSAESTDFTTNVLSKFIHDEVGLLCLTDLTLKMIGKRLWDKEKKKSDKKNLSQKIGYDRNEEVGFLVYRFSKDLE